MKRLSFWASQYIWRSRMLILVCYAFINWLGIFWAVLLLAHKLQPPANFPLLPCIATGAALLFYPGQKESAHFLRRKICDFGFAMSTLLFVIYGTAEALQPVAQQKSASAKLPWHKTETGQATPVSGGSRHGFAGFLHRTARNYGERSTAGKILLVALAVIVTIAVIIVWGAVCCGIVCGGAEALGYILFFAGSFGAIFGCVRIIQRIIRGPRNRRVRAY